MKKNNLELIRRLLKNHEITPDHLHRPILTQEEKELVTQYNSNVNVLVIRWYRLHGGLTDFAGMLRNLENMCKEIKVNYEEIETEDIWFHELRHSTYLRDENLKLNITEFSEVRDYIALLRQPFFQKYTIVSYMKSKGGMQRK